MKTKIKKQKTVKFKDSGFYFDDCEICQAMKKADERGSNLSGKELAEAFEKANEDNKN